VLLVDKIALFMSASCAVIVTQGCRRRVQTLSQSATPKPVQAWSHVVNSMFCVSLCRELALLGVQQKCAGKQNK
jgi:hypothetical protein